MSSRINRDDVLALFGGADHGDTLAAAAAILTRPRGQTTADHVATARSRLVTARMGIDRALTGAAVGDLVDSLRMALQAIAGAEASLDEIGREVRR